MNEMEKRAAIHAEHHHTKYDWREVYNLPATTPVIPRYANPGWTDEKEAKLEIGRKQLQGLPQWDKKEAWDEIKQEKSE